MFFTFLSIILASTPNSDLEALQQSYKGKYDWAWYHDKTSATLTVLGQCLVPISAALIGFGQISPPVWRFTPKNTAFLSCSLTCISTILFFLGSYFNKISQNIYNDYVDTHLKLGYPPRSLLRLTSHYPDLSKETFGNTGKGTNGTITENVGKDYEKSSESK